MPPIQSEASPMLWQVLFYTEKQPHDSWRRICCSVSLCLVANHCTTFTFWIWVPV